MSEDQTVEHDTPARCALCGKDPAEGLATIDGVRYCHGEWQESPTCYEQADQGWRKLDPDPAVALLKAIFEGPPRG